MDKIGVKVWDRILCCTTSWSPMAKSMEAMFLFVNLRRSLADCSLDANRCFKFPSYKKDLVSRRWSAIGIWWPDMLTWSSIVWDLEVFVSTILDVERKRDSHFCVWAKDQLSCFSFKVFFVQNCKSSDCSLVGFSKFVARNWPSWTTLGTTMVKWRRTFVID